MDRRTKTRLDVELTCYVGTARVIARPFRTVTKNVSRTGMLMQWDSTKPVPLVGRKLTVDLELPENSEYGPRVMQCRATVVRVDQLSGGNQALALKIHSMKFMQTPKAVRQLGTEQALLSMPLPTAREM